MERTTQIIICGLNPTRKAAFKSTCAARGETMTSAIARLMDGAVRKHRKDLRKEKKAKKAVTDGES